MSVRTKDKYKEFFKIYIEVFKSNSMEMAIALNINGLYLSEIIQRKRPLDLELLRKAKKLKKASSRI